jgi:hypothetical protein
MFFMKHSKELVTKLDIKKSWQDDALRLLNMIHADHPEWSNTRGACLAVAMTCSPKLAAKVILPHLKLYAEAHHKYLNLLQEYYPKGNDVFKVPRDIIKKLHRSAGLPGGGPGQYRQMQTHYENICCTVYDQMIKQIQDSSYGVHRDLHKYFTWLYSKLSEQLAKKQDHLSYGEYNRLKDILAREKGFTAGSLKMQLIRSDIDTYDNGFQNLFTAAFDIYQNIRGGNL